MDFRLEHLPVSEGQLPDVCLVLSNLLENAVEALRREGGGWLRARSTFADGYLTIVVGNSSSERLRRVNGRYLSSKAEGRFGVGLATVQEIARKYGGQAEFSADGKEFRAAVFLTCASPAGQGGASPPAAPPPGSGGLGGGVLRICFSVGHRAAFCLPASIWSRRAFMEAVSIRFPEICSSSAL